MILVYDGSFEEYLCLVYDVYYSRLQVSAIQKKMPSSLLQNDILKIEYDESKYKKVLKAMQDRFDKKSLNRIINIFFCDSVEFEMDLLAYIILGFKDSKNLENITNSSVLYIQTLEKELYRTNHKMSGFLRFEELDDGVLYAKIESKYNLLYLLGRHFIKRYNNQNYIIHDIERNLAFVKYEESVDIKVVSSYESPILSKDEEKFKKLWRSFFEHVSIESRKNKKLQQQYVPLSYRKYMSEFK
jgi:probable DNA metabolism protein